MVGAAPDPAGVESSAITSGPPASVGRRQQWLCADAEALAVEGGIEQARFGASGRRRPHRCSSRAPRVAPPTGASRLDATVHGYFGSGRASTSSGRRRRAGGSRRRDRTASGSTSRPSRSAEGLHRHQHQPARHAVVDHDFARTQVPGTPRNAVLPFPRRRSRTRASQTLTFGERDRLRVRVEQRDLRSRRCARHGSTTPRRSSRGRSSAPHPEETVVSCEQPGTFDEALGAPVEHAPTR